MSRRQYPFRIVTQVPDDECIFTNGATSLENAKSRMERAIKRFPKKVYIQFHIEQLVDGVWTKVSP